MKKETPTVVKEDTKTPTATPLALGIISTKKENPTLTTREIATLNDCNHSHVVRVLAAYGIEAAKTREYREHRAEILAGLQQKILESLTSAELKKATAYQKVGMFALLFDKERLERDQSTVNVAYDSASDRAQLAELKALQASAVDVEAEQGIT